MVHVTRSTTVATDPATALAYLADFSNAPEWDPATQRCTRIDDGPVQVGARWRNVSKVLGKETELEYQLTSLSDTGVVLEGRNKTATAVDDIRVVADGSGSKITYDARITFHGLARFADPLMGLYFKRVGDKTIDEITKAVAHRTR